MSWRSSLAMIVTLIISGGCQKSERDRRYEREIRTWGLGTPLANEAASRALQDQMLRTLTGLREGTSRGPKIGAVLISGTEAEVQVVVYWIEDSPTVDEFAVEIEGAREVRTIKSIDKQVLDMLSKEGDLSLYMRHELSGQSEVAAKIRSGFGRVRPVVNLYVAGAIADTTDEVIWLP
jgi:hypothetical protein